jgi:hypothetical protein
LRHSGQRHRPPTGGHGRGCQQRQRHHLHPLPHTDRRRHADRAADYHDRHRRRHDLLSFRPRLGHRPAVGLPRGTRRANRRPDRRANVFRHCGPRSRAQPHVSPDEQHRRRPAGSCRSIMGRSKRASTRCKQGRATRRRVAALPKPGRRATWKQRGRKRTAWATQGATPAEPWAELRPLRRAISCLRGGEFPYPLQGKKCQRLREGRSGVWFFGRLPKGGTLVGAGCMSWNAPSVRILCNNRSLAPAQSVNITLRFVMNGSRQPPGNNLDYLVDVLQGI